MIYCIEAWAFRSEEEPDYEEELVELKEFRVGEIEKAYEWIWNRLELGYQIRLYRRE